MIKGFRVVKADMTSTNGFIYPTQGAVTATDFVANEECGNGLHFWTADNCDFDACGYHGCDTVWLEVETDDAIKLHGKYKASSLNVLRTLTVKEMHELYPSLAFPFITVTAGYRGTATAGYSGTATAGYSGTATAGYRGTATAGDGGTATAGDCGTATAGDGGTIMLRDDEGILYVKKITKTTAGVAFKLIDGKFVKVI